MRVLVTGGAGFIGSHIVEELLHQQYEVAVVDNLSSGKREQVPPNVKFYEGDIRDKWIYEVFQSFQPECVIHQAAQVSVASSVQDPYFDAQQNVLGTVNLLEACVSNQVKKFVFASTAALYGIPETLPVHEQHNMQPISFYGLSKKNAEAYIQMFAQFHDLTYTILRYANVFGMRQNAHGEAGVIALFMDKMMHNESFSIYGDGTQTRDFIFVKDVAKANVCAIGKGNDEIINISTGTRTSVLDIVNELAKLTSYAVPPSFKNKRSGDIQDSVLSNQKAVSLLNWRPEYSFSEGLAETVGFHQRAVSVNR